MSFESFIKDKNKPVYKEERFVPFCEDSEISRIDIIKHQDEDVESSSSSECQISKGKKLMKLNKFSREDL
jgi:hypothetical protein